MAKAQPGSTQLSQTRKASEVHPLLKYCSDKKKKKKKKNCHSYEIGDIYTYL